jgi:hypothetical protein
LKTNLKNSINRHALLYFLLIPMVSVGLHWRIFSMDLIGVHLWRQSQTEINIQNFYRHDFNIMNPRNNRFNDGDNIMRFEFPIMQWLVAGAHKAFGESIIITRISMFIFSILGVLGVYFLLKWLWDDKIVALLGAWAFNFSPVFYYYAVNPLPDVFALSSAIWAIAFFFLYLKTAQKRAVVLSAFFLLLATLAKLPYIVFGSMVGIYAIQRLIKGRFSALKEVILVSLIFILFIIPALLWYSWVIPTWGNNGVLKGVFDNQIPLSKTLAIYQFHAFDLLPRLLMNYAAVPFFFVALFFMVKNKAFKHAKWGILAALGLSVIIYFFYESNMIDAIHDYYMLPFLPPLFIIVGYGIKQLWHMNTLTRSTATFLLVALPFFAVQTVKNYWSLEETGFNNDVIKYKDDLRKAVPNDALCIILNDYSNFVFSYQIDKQGYIFSDADWPPEWIGDMVKRLSVRYLYSDNRKMDDNPKVKPYLDALILERGSVRVFKLKDL